MATSDELLEQARLIERTLATLPEDSASLLDVRLRARLEGYAAGVRAGIGVESTMDSLR